MCGDVLYTDKLLGRHDADLGSHQEAQGTVRPGNRIEQIWVLILQNKDTYTSNQGIQQRFIIQEANTCIFNFLKSIPRSNLTADTVKKIFYYKVTQLSKCLIIKTFKVP